MNLSLFARQSIDRIIKGGEDRPGSVGRFGFAMDKGLDVVRESDSSPPQEKGMVVVLKHLRTIAVATFRTQVCPFVRFSHDADLVVEAIQLAAVCAFEPNLEAGLADEAIAGHNVVAGQEFDNVAISNKGDAANPLGGKQSYRNCSRGNRSSV